MPRKVEPLRPGEGRSDPGVPTRWLFHYHPQMTAAPLLAATPVARMTVGEDFMQAHVRSWAPDLLVFPLFSREFCRFLVDAGEALGEWGPGASAALELDKITPRLSDVVTQIVGRHANPVVRRVFLGMHAIEEVETPWLLRVDAGPAPALPTAWQRSPRALGFVVALSDAAEGGGLRFPRQQVVVGGLPVGHALMIPGGPSHVCEPLPVTTGTHQILGFRARPRDP